MLTMNRADKVKALLERRAVRNMTLSRVTANFQAAEPARRTMEGREYLVVPMVMITNGTHAGSQGALHYPEDELAKTPAVWNMKPVVVYHPAINGEGVSACDPDIVEQYKVGLIMNARYEHPALKAEAWIEEDRARDVDERVLEGVLNSQMMEVSTGLFTDNKKEGGQLVARNYRPDHLAILPDQVGACSIADGAGLCRNEAEDRLADILAKLEDRLGKPSAETAMGLFTEGALLLNELTHDDVRNQIRLALEEKYPGAEVWVADVYDDRAVYEQGGSLWQVDYTVDGNEVTLVGLPVRVNRIVSYEVASPTAATTNIQAQGESPMDQKELVDKLIANEATPWEESDREQLMAFDAKKLEAMVPQEAPAANADAVANAAKEGAKGLEPKPAEEPKPATPAPAANALSDEDKADIAFARKIRHERRAAATATITGNAANKLTAEQLAAMPDDTLQAMADSMAPATPATPTANYGGQATPPADAPAANQGTGEPLALPSLDDVE